MIKVSVTSTAVRNQSGKRKLDGKAYSLDFQNVWLHLYDREGQPDPHPTKVEIMLDHASDGAALYHPVGEYLLHPSSIYVNREGKLSVAPRLHAVNKQPKAVA